VVVERKKYELFFVKTTESHDAVAGIAIKGGVEIQRSDYQ
jgi:hypothetical protein